MQALNQKRSRSTLIIVLALFFLPTAVATLLYVSGWRTTGTANHGELIYPPVALAERTMQGLDGSSMKLSDLKGKWTMVYFDSAACPDSCISQLFFMRQIHLSQGKNLDKIQRVFFLTDDKQLPDLKAKLTEYENMLVVKLAAGELAAIRSEFALDKDADSARSIYFVDPYGNLMMRYRPGIEPAGMRKDLERLLKYSGGN